SYATHRTGVASKGRLLMLTGGEDAALHALLATRLADAYAMQHTGEHRRAGPRSRFLQWPELGHELVDRPGVRAQITAFLASDGRPRVARAGTAFVIDAAQRASAARGRFLFAVSGGKTPWQMMRELAQAPLDWPKVHVFQVDERIAPAGDPDRNLTHLQETLL